MGDRFYTEGNAFNDDDKLAEMRYQMMMDEDEEENLIDSSQEFEEETHDRKNPHERVHTQEQNYDGGDYFDIHQYKGIYYNDEVWDNEKNHWEITGAHFKYEDAIRRLQKLLEIQSKQKDKKLVNRDKPPSKLSIQDKINNVAKVKIILNYDKKRLSNKGSIKVNPSHKAKSNSVFKAIPHPSKLERHLKSVSSQAKQVMSDKKFKNSNSRGTFKPQTTRVMPNI